MRKEKLDHAVRSVIANIEFFTALMSDNESDGPDEEQGKFRTTVRDQLTDPTVSAKFNDALGPKGINGGNDSLIKAVLRNKPALCAVIGKYGHEASMYQQWYERQPVSVRFLNKQRLALLAMYNTCHSCLQSKMLEPTSLSRDSAIELLGLFLKTLAFPSQSLERKALTPQEVGERAQAFYQTHKNRFKSITDIDGKKTVIKIKPELKTLICVEKNDRVIRHLRSNLSFYNAPFSQDNARFQAWAAKQRDHKAIFLFTALHSLLITETKLVIEKTEKKATYYSRTFYELNRLGKDYRAALASLLKENSEPMQRLLLDNSKLLDALDNDADVPTQWYAFWQNGSRQQQMASPISPAPVTPSPV